MSAFQEAQTVEAKGIAVLVPWLKRRSDDGQLVLHSKGPMARHLQDIAGDISYNEGGRYWSVEVKVERKHTGRLFLETWSNKNLHCRADHCARGSNPGWMVKQRSELLLYYFLDADILYVCSLFRLQRWAFGYLSGATAVPGNIYRFEEVHQRRYSQKNDTWGRLVPVEVLEAAVGLRRIESVRDMAA